MTVLVLDGIPPTYILADERLRFNARRGAKKGSERRGNIIGRWEVFWSNSPKGAWTKRLIPNFDRWTRRLDNFPVSFHLSKVLTEDCCFQQYLFRRNRTSPSTFIYCAALKITTEYTVFDCVHWVRQGRSSQVAHERLSAGECRDRPMRTFGHWSFGTASRQTAGGDDRFQVAFMVMVGDIMMKK